MDPYSFLKEGQVVISNETYAIVKAKKIHPHAFATIIDQHEITVVIDQSKVNPEDILEIEQNWKLLTFEMTLPFDLVGFLAIIAQALARAKIAIFALSAYSTDYILVKHKDLEQCQKVLSQLGCQVFQKN